MRRLTFVIGGTVAVVGVAAAVSAYAALQYSHRVQVEGIGKTRFRTAQPTLRLLATHPGELGHLRVTVDGDDVSNFASTDGRGIVVQGAAIADGWHVVRISARSSGLFGTKVARRFSIVIDTHRPRLTLMDTTTYRTGLTLDGRTEKGATVLVRWKGGRLTRTAPTGRFSIEPGLPDGRYVLRITARDPVGNVSRVRWQRIVLDSMPPAIDLSAVPTVLEQATTTLTGAVADGTPSALRATLDGQAIALRGPDGQQLRFAPKGTTQWSVPLQNLTEGVHDLQIVATDAARNQVQVERHFTVDSTEKLRPGITLTIGARGKDVAQLERRLSSEGLWKGKATRFYNLRTAAAVKRYQAKHSMPQTGIANPAVIEATKGHIVVQAAPLQGLRVPRRQAHLQRADRDRHARARDADGQLQHHREDQEPHLGAPELAVGGRPRAGAAERVEPARHALDRHERAGDRVPHDPDGLVGRACGLARLHAHAPDRRGEDVRACRHRRDRRHQGVI